MKQIPNKKVLVYYKITKKEIMLYDSNGKYCDSWEVSKAISGEFKDYYKNIIDKRLAVAKSSQELLKAFFTPYKVVSQAEASNVFISNDNKRLYIKVV